MKYSSLKYWWLIAAIASFSPLTFCHANDLNLPTLTVRGSAILSKPADELRINIGAVSQGETAEDALKNNNKKMERIIKSLMQNGLQKEEYATGRFNIRPVYSERPKNPKPEWSPEIVGYEVANSLTIKTDKLDTAGVLIDQAAKAGANSIDNIAFHLKDPNKYRGEVIDAAARKAIEDAKILSQATGTSLVRIQTVILDEATPTPMPRNASFFMKTASQESVPIEPGEIEVSGAVTIVYEIR